MGSNDQNSVLQEALAASAKREQQYQSRSDRVFRLEQRQSWMETGCLIGIILILVNAGGVFMAHELGHGLALALSLLGLLATGTLTVWSGLQVTSLGRQITAAT